MTDTLAPAPEAVRDKLVLALDVDDLVVAVRMAKDLRPWFGTVKVGLELYSAEGPGAITSLVDLGYRVFGDLKLHDIPTTVGRAARVLGSIGVSYLTLHAQGGADMLAAGVEGLRSGAADAGLAPPAALAVTVLTSDGDAPQPVLAKRVQLALEADCDGIVCAASDVREAKQYGPRLIAAVPGIRPSGSAVHDQARVATPSEAVAAGADLLVVGRAVTGADEPAAAASAIASEVWGALER